MEYTKDFSARLTELRKRCKAIIERKRKKKKFKGEQFLKRVFEERTENMVRDMHYHCIKVMLNNDYTDILLPRMNVNNMVEDPSLRKEVKRNLRDLRFGQFRTRLINKVEVLGNGRNVHTCNEARTSITCSRCFRMHPNLGSSEVYKCQYCHNSMDRDWNAVANIEFKYIYVEE